MANSNAEVKCWVKFECKPDLWTSKYIPCRLRQGSKHRPLDGFILAKTCC